MYEVTIRRHIAAAHALREIGGTCENLHGHNFIIEVSVTGEHLDPQDLLIDFRELKAWIDEALQPLDHQNLNDLETFRGINPSSERLAQTIYDQIAPRASASGLSVSRVVVWESEDARIAYEPPRQERSRNEGSLSAIRTTT